MIRYVLLSFHFLLTFTNQSSASMPAEDVEILKQSSLHIAEAGKKAAAENRELHIFLGAHPMEDHIINMLKNEQAKEAQDSAAGVANPFKCPVRIYFNSDSRYGKLASSAQAPILSADFNEMEYWNILVEALDIQKKGDFGRATNNETFNGVVDKIYFDWSTVKFASWSHIVVLRLAMLLKKTGEIFIPDVNLSSQSTFAESILEVEAYRALSPAEKKVIPYEQNLNPINNSGSFLRGMSMTCLEKRGDKSFVMNGTSLVCDSNFMPNNSSTGLMKKIGALRCESFEFGDGKLYPNIGMLERGDTFCVHIDTFVKVMTAKK
jgi:hypothetical protein